MPRAIVADSRLGASMNAVQSGLRAARKASARNAAMIERLVPIAQQLAGKAGMYGITVSDIRLAAYQRGLLNGTECGRDLSYLGSVPAAAGLVNTGQTRRSILRVTHGIRQTVWVTGASSPYRTEYVSPYSRQ